MPIEAMPALVESDFASVSKDENVQATSDIEALSRLLAILVREHAKMFPGSLRSSQFELVLYVYIAYARELCELICIDITDCGSRILEERFDDVMKFCGDSLVETQFKIWREAETVIETFPIVEARRTEVLRDHRRLGYYQLVSNGTSGSIGRKRTRSILFDMAFRLTGLVLKPLGRPVVQLEGTSRRETLWLSLALRRAVIHFHSQGPLVKLAPDREARRKLLRVISNSDVFDSHAKVICGIALALLSVPLLEGLSECFQTARRLLDEKPAVILSGLGYLKPVELLFLALSKSSPSLIYSMQHGGSYGELVDTWQYRVERRISDRYLTFGWAYSSHERPCRSNRLSRLHRSGGPNLGEVLIVLENMVALDRPRKVDKYLTRAAQIEEKLSTIARVLGELAAEGSIRKVRLRFHPTNRSRLQDVLSAKYFPSAEVSNSRLSLSDDASTCALCVFDSIGATGALECLAIEVPVVHFDPYYKLAICPEANGIYKELLEGGVLTTNGELLKQSISAALGCPSTREAFIAATQRYRDNYASSENSMLDLAKCLR